MAVPQQRRRKSPRFTICLTQLEYVQIWGLANQHDVSAAWIIRRAIEHYLGRTPKGAVVEIEQDKKAVPHRTRMALHKELHRS